MRKTTKRPPARKAVGPRRKKQAKRKPAKKTRTKGSAKAPTRKRARTPAAPQPTPIAEGADLLASISQLAYAIGAQRETVRNRLTEALVAPSRRSPRLVLYSLRQALPVLFQQSDGALDPDKLDPFKRRAYYQGELDKLKLQEQRGELVPSFEVERKFAALLMILTRGLDTLPDVIERDVGASPEILIRIEQCVDDIRRAMAQLIREHSTLDETDADRPSEAR